MSMPPCFLGKPENVRPFLQINHLFGGLEHLLFFHILGIIVPTGTNQS